MIHNISGKMVAFAGFMIGFASEIGALFGDKITTETFFVAFALVISGLVMIKIEEVRDELKKHAELEHSETTLIQKG